MKKKILGLKFGISLAIAAISGGYIILNHYANKEIKTAVVERAFLPPDWITILPGKADKTIDLYLQNMAGIYSVTSVSERHLVPAYVLQFTKDYVPKRISEVAEKGIDFLIEKKDFRAAYRVAESSGNLSLINDLKKRTGYEHKPHLIPFEMTKTEKKAVKKLKELVKPVIKRDPLRKVYGNK